MLKIETEKKVPEIKPKEEKKDEKEKKEDKKDDDDGIILEINNLKSSL